MERALEPHHRAVGRAACVEAGLRSGQWRVDRPHAPRGNDRVVQTLRWGAGNAIPVGPASAGKASDVTPQMDSVLASLFPAEAGPTRVRVHRSDAERQQPRSHAERGDDRVVQTPRCRAVNTVPVGPASAGKASDVTPQMDSVLAGLFPAEAGPTMVRVVPGTCMPARPNTAYGLNPTSVPTITASYSHTLIPAH